MSDAELEAIIGEAHAFLADRELETDLPAAQSDRPVARQHSTVPPSLFFRGIPPRPQFRIPPGFPLPPTPEPLSSLLNLEPLTDHSPLAIVPEQSNRSHEPILTTSPTDQSAGLVVAANHKHSHSEVSSTESCTLNAFPSASVSVKSATIHNKTGSSVSATRKGKKRKRQYDPDSQPSPRRLRQANPEEIAALESEPRDPLQLSCRKDKKTSEGRNLNDSRSIKTPGGGRDSQVHGTGDDDWGAREFFNGVELFPNGPPSPVHDAMSPRPNAVNVFMSGALIDSEASTRNSAGARPSTSTRTSGKGTAAHHASEVNSENTILRYQGRQSSHIRFHDFSTPERRNRSIYRRYGTEPVLSSAQLSPADAVKRQVANISQVFRHADTATTSSQLRPSESRSAGTSAAVVDTAPIVRARVDRPRRAKQRIEERRRLYPPLLPPYVPASKRVSDEELIKIGTFWRIYDRHSSAPYAYRYSGKLTADYLYLAELKHPDNSFRWEEKVRKKLIKRK